MSELVKILKENGFNGIGNLSDNTIIEAQNKLGLRFSNEYKDFLKNFQAGSFLGHELMGLDTMAYLNVVNNTEDEREMNDDFPKDCIVLENLGIEGLLVLMNESGVIFSYCNGKKEQIADSMVDYIRLCVEESTKD